MNFATLLNKDVSEYVKNVYDINLGGLNNNERLEFIDTVVRNVQDSTAVLAEKHFIALLLLFKPLIYKLLRIYKKQLARFCYSREDILHFICVEFYQLTKKFNFKGGKFFCGYTIGELRDALKCLLKKEENHKKYNEHYSKLNSDNIEPSMLDNIVDCVDLDRKKEQVLEVAESVLNKREYKIFNTFIDGYNKPDVLKKYNINSNKFVYITHRVKREISNF